MKIYASLSLLLLALILVNAEQSIYIKRGKNKDKENNRTMTHKQ